jgi:glycosyltransferase 2 family protein
VLALVGAAAWMLRGQLPAVWTVARETHPRWPLVLGASAIVLLTYALLIESWRRVLGVLGGALAPSDAARIWFVSNLARLLPGALWQLGAMSEMARRRGVAVTVSTGAAILVYIVNLFTGLAVAGVFAGATLRERVGAKAWLILGLGAAALALAPLVVPRLVLLSRRITGRDIVMPRFGIRPVLVAATSTAISWLAYGVAFWIMTRALLAGDSRSLGGCIALYTISYLAGLLNPAPAGIGAAESMMVFLAPQLGVATQAEALVLAVAVRIWRTVLEVLPGLVALPFARRELVEEAAQPSRGSRIP